MKTHLTALIVTSSIVALLFAGCSKEPGATPAAGSTPAAKSAPVADAPKELTKVKVGIIGLTCEAPIYMAVEKGFFAEEGLEAELVKCEWSKYKDVMALGGFDITHHLIMMFLKPIEQGMDAKIIAGVHTGCLRVQAGVNTNIKTVKDLKGKRIGVPGMGTPPFIFANRVMGANGMDPSKDVEWKVFPAGELGLALQKGEVDAVANAEPIGSLLLADGKVRNVADQATDEPYKDEYCCAVIANGKWASANTKVCAAATRAILKGAKWVQTNPRAAARLSVEKKYLASNPELNTTALGHLDYLPSIAGGLKSVGTAATEMKKVGMLSATTDVNDLVKRAWLPLDGVSDKWIQELKVEKVAGGQVPPDQADRLAAELNTDHAPVTVATCCTGVSKVLR